MHIGDNLSSARDSIKASCFLTNTLLVDKMTSICCLSDVSRERYVFHRKIKNNGLGERGPGERRQREIDSAAGEGPLPAAVSAKPGQSWYLILTHYPRHSFRALSPSSPHYPRLKKNISSEREGTSWQGYRRKTVRTFLKLLDVLDGMLKLC